MLNNYQDLKVLSEQRQAEWEQRIRNETEVARRPVTERWYHRLLRKSTQKEKGCDLPSPVSTLQW